jgi:AraC-like DNA-binding protein
MAHAVEHLHDPGLDIDTLATRACMSRRTFDRRFRELTGDSPLQWLLVQRINQAQHLLETTDASIDVIARNVGFTNAVALRPHFRRVVGIAPQTYRRPSKRTAPPARAITPVTLTNRPLPPDAPAVLSTTSPDRAVGALTRGLRHPAVDTEAVQRWWPERKPLA